MLKGRAVTQRDLRRLQERPTGTSRNVTRTVIKSYTWEEQPLAMARDGD